MLDHTFTPSAYEKEGDYSLWIQGLQSKVQDSQGCTEKPHLEKQNNNKKPWDQWDDTTGKTTFNTGLVTWVKSLEPSEQNWLQETVFWPLYTHWSTHVPAQRGPHHTTINKIKTIKTPLGSWALEHMPAILAFKEWRLEDWDFKVILGKFKGSMSSTETLSQTRNPDPGTAGKVGGQGLPWRSFLVPWWQHCDGVTLSWLSQWLTAETNTPSPFILHSPRCHLYGFR